MLNWFVFWAFFSFSFFFWRQPITALGLDSLEIVHYIELWGLRFLKAINENVFITVGMKAENIRVRREGKIMYAWSQDPINPPKKKWSNAWSLSLRSVGNNQCNMLYGACHFRLLVIDFKRVYCLFLKLIALCQHSHTKSTRR